MKRWRMIKFQKVSHPVFRLEHRRYWWPFWCDMGFPDFNSEQSATEQFMAVVANRGAIVVVAIQ